MSNNEKKDIIEKVISYFTEELGYPRRSIFRANDFKSFDVKFFKKIDLLIFIFGQIKMVIKISQSNILSDTEKKIFKKRVRLSIFLIL